MQRARFSTLYDESRWCSGMASNPCSGFPCLSRILFSRENQQAIPGENRVLEGEVITEKISYSYDMPGDCSHIKGVVMHDPG